MYARDSRDPAKRARAAQWISSLGPRAGHLSVQVLNEYYVTVTRKLRPGLSSQEARADVLDLHSWEPVAVDRTTVESAWMLEDRFSLSFWDALIVASARLQSCTHLLSEDFQQGQDLDGLVVIDPFSTAPEEVK